MSEELLPPPPSGQPVGANASEPPKTDEVLPVSSQNEGAAPPPPAGVPLETVSPFDPAPEPVAAPEPVLAPESASASEAEPASIKGVTAPQPAADSVPVASQGFTAPQPAVDPVPVFPGAAPPPQSYTEPMPAPMPEPVPTAPIPAAGPAYGADPLQASPMPVGVPMQGTAPMPSAAPYSPQAAPQMPQPPAKKKSKKPLIITLVAVLAVALIVGGVFGIMELMRSSTYDAASAAYSAGNYAEARDGFSELGDYRDSAIWLNRTLKHITYEDAIASFEAGDYAAARSGFESVRGVDFNDIDDWIAKIDLAEGIQLFEAEQYDEARELLTAASEAGVSEAADWVDEIDYIRAEQLLTAGDVEAAYYAFNALGSYKDAADRATACTQPFPASGILYQAEGSYYEFCALEIVYNYTDASFYKIYSGSNLVATVFMNGNSTVRIYLQPGDYTIKEGTGSVWFGPDLAFGIMGNYSTMTYDDSGTDFFTLAYGNLMTLTINTSEAGNVGSRDEDHSSF